MYYVKHKTKIENTKKKQRKKKLYSLMLRQSFWKIAVNNNNSQEFISLFAPCLNINILSD